MRRLTTAQAKRMGIVVKSPTKAIRSPSLPKNGRAEFMAMCCAHGLPIPEPEYRFMPPRRWRFDWAWPDAQLAVEVQGGLFCNGGHVRGGHLKKEYEKLNEACVLGWRILFVLPEQVQSGEVFGLVARALESQCKH